ncbi:MAG: DUF2442 domain-containing protein [Ignavibacteriales bacterium]|nr:DUF2442 domain-containing protein [Ignavibacteriales bacterium]
MYKKLQHSIHKITSVKVVGPYQLDIRFSDNERKLIDFRPVLSREMYAPLRDVTFFNQVTLDKEVHTIVWPNGADFEPTLLYNWEEYKEELIQRARE